MVDVIPVDVSEEGMGHDLLCVSRTGSQTHLGLAGKQLLKNRDRVARHVDGVEGLVGENGVVDFVFIFTTER